MSAGEDQVERVKAQLSQAIAARIDQLGLTQSEAARLMQIDRPATCRIVNGTLHRIALQRIIGAAERLGVPVKLTPFPHINRHGVPAE